MLREQTINFLETAVVLLMLINAFSLATTVYAIAIARRVIHTGVGPASEPRLLAVLARRLRVR